jgi:hypothetical protein
MKAAERPASPSQSGIYGFLHSHAGGSSWDSTVTYITRLDNRTIKILPATAVTLTTVIPAGPALKGVGVSPSVCSPGSGSRGSPAGVNAPPGEGPANKGVAC